MTAKLSLTHVIQKASNLFLNFDLVPCLVGFLVRLHPLFSVLVLEESVIEKFLGAWSIIWILFKTHVNEILEIFCVVAPDTCFDSSVRSIYN